MSQPPRASDLPPPPAESHHAASLPVHQDRVKADAMLCDRCQAEMFRMHAVWRCPACGYKTDCCGW
jgi:rubrerythrin